MHRPRELDQHQERPGDGEGGRPAPPGRPPLGNNITTNTADQSESVLSRVTDDRGPCRCPRQRNLWRCKAREVGTAPEGAHCSLQRQHAQAIADYRAAEVAPVVPERTAPPVLDAYRSADGVQLAVWCDHERCWHWHGRACTGECGRPRGFSREDCKCPPGTGDGHRGAHCRCPDSPYADTGYELREVGELTDAVRAAHVVGPWACVECARLGLCSCEQTRCTAESCVGLCAEHADPECASCWATHGGPGYGVCRWHGMTKMHAHTVNRKRCVVYGDDPACDLAYDVMQYWPTPSQAQPHVHCPYCWAVETVVRRRRGWRVPPPCPSCRKLVDDTRVQREAGERLRWLTYADTTIRREAS